MGLTQTINYDNASELTFDSSKVETVGGETALKLGYTPITSFSEDFSDDTDFIYDDNKAEFSGGKIQQKDLSPSNSVMAADFSGNVDPIDGTQADLIWHKTGSVTATLNGSPTIVGGKLNCSSGQGVSWLKTTSAIETIKFLYTPNYSTGPSTNVNIFGNKNASGNNDRFELFNSPSGNDIRINMYSNSAGLIVSGVLGAWNPTGGQEYEFELVINSTSGTIRLLINGNLLGTLSPGAWSRGGIAANYYIGANTSIYNEADGKFDAYIAFSNAQHSSNYTPGYSIVPYIYAETSATLPIFTYLGPGLLRPAGVPTSTETGSPRYIVQNYYWNGSAWVTSDGTYAQATSKSDIVSNIATFPITELSTITVKVIFGNSQTQSNVDQIDFDVVGELYPTDNPTIVTNAYTLMDALESFAADFDASGNDTVKFLVAKYTAVGGAPAYLYWNGSAWVTSDGTYAQANTAIEINDNCPDLDLEAGYYVRIFVFLHSDDSLTTPSIISIEFDYSFYLTPPIPTRCLIYGIMREVDNTVFANGTVTVVNKYPYFNSGILIPPSSEQYSIDSEGRWEAELIETESTGKTVDFIFETSDDDGKTVKARNITIPNQETKDFSEFGDPIFD